MKLLRGISQPIYNLDMEPFVERSKCPIPGQHESSGDQKHPGCRCRIVTVKRILADRLASGISDSPSEAMALAVKLVNEKEDEITVEDAQIGLLEEAMNDPKLPPLTNLAKSAVLDVLRKAEEV